MSNPIQVATANQPASGDTSPAALPGGIAPASISGGIINAAEATAPSFMDAMGGTPAPDPTPAPAKPSLWRSVLTGALSGLAGSAGSTSFAGGAARGAASELNDVQRARLQTMADQQQQSEVKFRDAQSAHMMAETAVTNTRLHMLPQQMQDEHNASALAMMKDLSGAGLSPMIVLPNTDAHATTALSQITASHGSVPSVFTLNLGDKIVAYDLNQLTSGDGDNVLNTVNKYGRVLGRADISKQDWAQLPSASKVNIVNQSLGALQVVPDPAKIQSQIAEAENQASTYGALPAWKQDSDITARLQSNIAFLKKSQATFDAHQIKQGAAVKGAETAAEGAAKTKAASGNVLTGAMADGTLVAGTAEELASAGVKNPYKLPAADVSKMEVARQLVSPGGLFDNVAADITNLNKSGQLGVAASRWNNILTNKLGTGDENFARLATDIGLLQTAVMQAHVGAKGGNEMLEHFKQTIGDANISTAPILLARLGASWDYMNHKAMRIPAKGGK